MPQSEMKPSSTIIFNIPELDRWIVDLIPEMPKPSRWPAFNAIQHLNLSWKIKDIDPQMSLFRAITAEEEAATALFLSIKRHNYDGAKSLNKFSHIQKNTVIPVFDAISRVVAKFGSQMPPTEIYLDTKEEKPKLAIRFKKNHPLTGVPSYAYPIPPLNFSIFGGKANGTIKKEDFSAGIEEIVKNTNVNNIFEHLKNRANLRNQLLYAAPEGYPSINGNIETTLQQYQKNTFVILRMYMLIDPYAKIQLFVQQALYVFLKTINKLTESGEVNFL